MIWMSLFVFLYFFYFFNFAVLCNTNCNFSNFHFISEPVDICVSKDKPVLLNCLTKYDISSSEVVQISWTKDGMPLSTNGRRSLLSNGSLLLESRFEEGTYQCIASLPDVGTIVSLKAQLQFSYLDKFFADDLKDISVYLGDTAILWCHINGHPHPTVTHWYKNDAELNVSTSNYAIHRDENMLEIGVVTFSDFGRFKCKVSNGDKWKTSPDINLIQNIDIASYQGVSPRFLTKSRDLHATERSTVTLPCAANGLDRKSKRPQIQWLKEGIALDIHSEERYSIEGKGSLHIEDVQEMDAGTYICRAFNLEDAIDAHYVLTVLVPPRFKSRPSNILVTEATDALISCEVYAVPRANIQWLKDGKQVIPDEHLQLEGTNLRLLGVQNSDAGMYQCFASNEVKTIHAIIQLLVVNRTKMLQSIDLLPPQELVSPIVSMHFVALSWNANAVTSTIYNIIWEEFVADSKQRTINITSTEANIQFLKAETSYKFEVRSIVNQYASFPSILIVNTQPEVQVPDAPTNFQASIISSPATVKLTWSADSPNFFANYTAPTGYKIYYYEIGTTSAESELKVDYGVQHYILNLKKLRTYAFRILAYNDEGLGSSSEEIMCKTYSDVPSVIPQNFSVEPQSPNSLIARWEPSLDEGSQIGFLNGYRIQYKPSKEKSTMPFFALSDASQQTHSINDLEPGTEYSLRIAAQSRNGTGPWSNWIQTHTYAHDLDETNVPGPPSSINVVPKSNSIIISWMPPVEQEVIVRGYIIRYGVGYPDMFQQMVDPKQRYHTIKGLQSASEYVLSLKAYNKAGEGMPVYETTVTKDDAVVDASVQMIPPVGLKATVLSASAVFLTWTDTTLGRNQRVSDGRHYTIRYTQKSQKKYKFINSTDLNYRIEDLKADSEYEFAVRTVKGKRQSAYSLSVFNRTRDSSPTSAPRDLTAYSVDGRPKWVTLSWQPPRQSNGLITGYLISYTMDFARKELEWSTEAINGDRLSSTIKDLSLETLYYFKIKAKNTMGYGPMSPTIRFKTPGVDGFGGGQLDNVDDNKELRYYNNNDKEFGDIWLMWSTVGPHTAHNSISIPPNILWMSIGGVITIAVISLLAVIIVICVKRNGKNNKMEDKSCYSNKDAKSSICGSSNVELKPPDLWIHGRNTTMRSEDADESTEMLSQHPSSFDEDCGSDSERYRHGSNRFKLKPLDNISTRDPYVLNLLNGHGSTTPTSSINRPNYPRTQYTSSQNPYPSAQHVNNTPRVNAALLNYPPHEEKLSIEKVKNVGVAPSFLNLAKSKQACLSNLDNDQNADSKSFTTEELTAEMANLEGLMKDLSAITQNEYEC